MSHLMDVREVLISLATAALTAAEADAEQTNELIFRPEWKPTPRTRNPTDQPQSSPPSTGARQLSWASHLRRVLSELEREADEHRSPPLPREPARTGSAPPPPPSMPAPPSPPPVPSVPASKRSHPSPPQPQLQKDAVAELIKKNQDVFDKIIDHPFPQALGNATASLDGFRYYMIQDKLYLETYARLKMIAVASSPRYEDVKTFGLRHQSSIEYVDSLKEICISMLGIPESTIESTLRSVQLDASENFYKTAVRQEDALLGYYIVLLPCILSYWEISKRLMDDPSTVRNVIYHPAWTVTNYDSSSAEKYTKFINENIMAKGGVDRWNHVFRTACLLEADLFNTGLRPPAPYHIIPDGTYFIHSPSLKNVVLAVQNIKGVLRSPLDQLLGGYFPSDAGLSVVGVNKTGEDNEKWRAVVTKNGYTFQNLETGLYLGIATELNRKEGRVLQGVKVPYYWWINPVPSKSNSGSPAYQIYDSVNLQYTLHADTEVLNSVGSTNFRYTPVIARGNSELTCQMWSFNDEHGQPVHTQLRDEQTKSKDEGGQAAKRPLNGQSAPLAGEAVNGQAVKGDLNGQSAPPPSRADKSEVIFIAVMGMSKSGKSTFINLATRSGDLRVGSSASSCTDVVEAAPPFELDGRRVVLLDTPSFDHTHKSETEILRIIALELESKYRQGIKLHGIIYLHRISDVRITNSAKQSLLLLRKLSGDQYLRNVVIVTNMWHEVNAEDGKRRATDLQFSADIFRSALQAGARLMHHTDGTAEFAHAIVRSMMRNQPETLAIQEELVNSGMDIDQTSVGKEVSRWIGKRIERYEAQEDEVWESAEQARKDGDEQTRKELEEELKRIRVKTARLEKEKVGQALEYKRRQQQQHDQARAHQ